MKDKICLKNVMDITSDLSPKFLFYLPTNCLVDGCSLTIGFELWGKINYHKQY